MSISTSKYYGTITLCLPMYVYVLIACQNVCLLLFTDAFESILTISNVQMIDSGLYQCLVDDTVSPPASQINTLSVTCKLVIPF